MSDRTFRLAPMISNDDTNTIVLDGEFVTFDPLSTDEYGNNERVFEHVAKWLLSAKYEAQQLDLADEHDSAENRADARADRDCKIRKAEMV